MLAPRQHRILTLIAATALVISGGIFTASRADDPAGASRVWVVESEHDRDGISVAQPTPSGFALTLTREMPTPGWELRVDEVQVDAAASRVVVKLTEIGPQGIVAQVLTTTTVDIPLGPIQQGSYFVEIWGRRKPGAEHQPAQAVVIRAH